jgi:hypothetical protein
MDVIDKYFHRLRLFLPKDQRDDIIHELSGEVRAQAAAEEDRLGRPLTRDEQAALIAHFGHPMLLAARYWPQRHVIGPVFYPYYWLVLRVALGLAIAAHVIAALVLMATGNPWADVGRSFTRLWDAALAVFAWTTVGFWMVDWHLTRRCSENIDLTSPPGGARQAAAAAVQTADRAVQDVDRALRDVRGVIDGMPRVPPMAQFLVNAVITAWWLLALKFPALVFGPASSVIAFGPIWDRFYLPIAVLAVLGLVRHYLALTRPGLGRRLVALQTAIRTGALIVLYFILSAREWVVFSGSGVDAARYNVLIDIDNRQVPLLELINYSVAVLLIAVGILCVAGIVQALRRPARAIS